MELKAKIVKYKNQFYDYVTEPKRVKWCTIAGLFSFIVFLLIAVYYANFFDPAQFTTYEWNGYNIFNHYISDLGSVRYTPIPVLLNILWMVLAILFTPLVFYLYKKVHISYKGEEKWDIKRVGKWILINIGFFFMVVGILGWFWVGFYSEDEGRLLAQYGILMFGMNYHRFFSMVVFGGFVIAGIFIGLFFILYPKTVRKIIDLKLPWIVLVILGLEMVIWPTLHMMFFLLTEEQFHEWFMMFALMVWLYPVGCVAIKMINNDLKSR
ncbi:MAG: hypothetical protein ACFFBP_06485 [Promethearchaeota archaeon]